jgi:Zn-dependent peptidase ImmA (M78 family)
MVGPKRAVKKWKSAAARRVLELAGNPPTVESAVRIVAGDAIKDVPHPPLALEILAKKVGVTAIVYEDVPFSAELRPDNGSYVVACSLHLSPSRRRFTIAHELSHAILEKSGRNCPRIGPELERLCDMIATEMLMPRESFLNHVVQAPTIDSIFQVARIFQTSVTATALRFAELLGVSVFEAEQNSVVWSYGAVNKGPIRFLDSHLQRLIADGIAGGQGEASVRLLTRGFTKPWRVEYRGIKNGRALFLLQPGAWGVAAVAS